MSFAWVAGFAGCYLICLWVGWLLCLWVFGFASCWIVGLCCDFCFLFDFVVACCAMF